MTDPLIVHVVCEAEYESNGPVALFTDPEAAEQHAADCRREHRGEYEVRSFPLLDRAPKRALKHLRAGRVCGPHGVVEDEQSWTVAHWDFELPAEPVVTIDGRFPEMPRVHIAAASAEAAESAFRVAVRQIQQSIEENARC
jgi:hypothetical protein